MKKALKLPELVDLRKKMTALDEWKTISNDGEEIVFKTGEWYVLSSSIPFFPT